MFIEEFLSAIAAAIAAFAALLALVRCKLAAREASRAIVIAQRALDEMAFLNSPVLLFACDTCQEKNMVEASITIFNSGNRDTEIVNGRITVNLLDPPANQIRELQGKKISGRREHLEQFRLRASLLEKPVEIVCEATYTREGEPNAVACECFAYDPHRREFTRQLRQVATSGNTAGDVTNGAVPEHVAPGMAAPPQ